MANETRQPGPAVTSALRFSRDGLLSPFGLGVVATILAALASVSMLALNLLSRHMRTRAAQSGPAMITFLGEVVGSQLDAAPQRLQRLVNDIARMPDVTGSRLVLHSAPGGAGPADGDSDSAQVFTPPGVVEPRGQHLRIELRGETRGAGDPPVRGVLEVWHDAGGLGGAPGILTALWTASGAVGAVSLIVFAMIYRGLRRRIRPISFVSDNLLAYHRGAEQSLQLLSVQDASEPIAQAWNGLIRFVGELQRELDGLRCRQSLLNSSKSVQMQSSQAILDALPIGLARIGPGDRFLYFNYSAAQMLGITDDGSDNMALSARLSDAGLAERLRDMRGGVTGETSAGAGVPGPGYVDYELGGPKASSGGSGGGTVVRITPVPVADAPDDELVVMVQDVSQLIEASRSRDAFLAHITHELRTPLTNIRAYAETLSEDFFDDEQTRRECYNVIMSETRRLSRLIEDVLSVSQIEAGGSRFERVPVRIDQSLRQVVQDVQANADAKSIELSLRIPSKVPDVLGDRMRLAQVWINLLGNAIKYTPAGGSVTVTVQSDEHVVRVCVTDTGIGIAPEHHQKVFEKFYRVERPDVEATEGTGLGLAITQEIVRMHGGRIYVESEPGAGSNFVVELPRAKEGAVAAQPA